jgi:8-oxo-dGTP diphosphatase
MWNAMDRFGRKHKKTTGASIFFVNDADQILLCLRDNKESIPFPNCWDALGGSVEGNETPLECITREMREEIGVALQTPRLFKVYDLEDRIECAFWQRADLDIEKIDLQEGQRLQWFTEKEISELPGEDMAFGFKPILLEFFSKKPWQE